MNRPHAATRRPLPGSPFNVPSPQPLEQYALDDRVTHDRYGLGRIIGIEEDAAILVDFGLRRVRIRVPYLKLTKL